MYKLCLDYNYQELEILKEYEILVLMCAQQRKQAHNNKINHLLEEIRRLKLIKINKPIQTQSQQMDKPKSEKIIKRPAQRSQEKQIPITNFITKPIVQIFQGLTFCIPIRDVQLTPGIVASLTKQIQLRKGNLVQFNQHMRDVRINFLLCSRKVNLIELEKKLEGKILCQQILDYMYVKHCINRDILLAVDDYLLYDGMDIKPQQKEEEDTLTSSVLDKIKKKLKTEHQEILNNQQKISQIEDQPKKELTRQERKRLVRRYQQPKKQDYICQKGNRDQHNFSINNFICEQLSKLQKIYQNQRDIGRKIAYLKAISAIKSYPKEIQSEEDLKEIRGIGRKITEKIKQLIETGRLEKLQTLNMSQKRVVTGELTKVWGIGPAKALQLYNRGIKSIAELRQKSDYLNKNQRIGLKYYQDFSKRIPRQKVTRMFEFVKSVFFQLVGSQTQHKLEVCGSYRRNKATCGDMDIIITRTDGTYQKRIVLDLIQALQQRKFLTDHLSLPGRQDRSSMSYMGVCQFEDQQHHRIDIKYYPVEQFAFAILYFTGSDAFNRSMRLFAKRKGYMLSDHGLSQIERTNRTDRQHDCQKILLYTQEDIFKFLGLDYKTPIERSV